MEKAKKNGNIVLIVILVLMVLSLGGYIAYDKILSKDTTDTTMDNSKNELGDNSIDKDNTMNNDINNNQAMKFHYYVSKEESADEYRCSLTLSLTDDNRGFFSINLLSQFEAPHTSGFFRIENNKVILSFLDLNNDDQLQKYVFLQLHATLVDDPDQEKSPNYKAYITDYNEHALQIGNYKLYRVEEKYEKQ